MVDMPENHTKPLCQKIWKLISNRFLIFFWAFIQYVAFHNSKSNDNHLVKIDFHFFSQNIKILDMILNFISWGLLFLRSWEYGLTCSLPLV